ncbi:MAG: hypothetical protein U9Q85_04195 [Patescibacteria group bacterium]|nr:hypothetical protein [Patescibacteria group bacterium]
MSKTQKNQDKDIIPIKNEVYKPLWVSISAAAQLGGVSNKTVRRAVSDKKIRFKIVNNRYLLDLRSFIRYLYANTKLKNKLNEKGIGQYITGWRD